MAGTEDLPWLPLLTQNFIKKKPGILMSENCWSRTQIRVYAEIRMGSGLLFAIWENIQNRREMKQRRFP